LYRDSKTALARDGKYCAVAGGPPGLFPTPLPGQSAGGLRQVTQTTSIAVPLGGIGGRHCNQIEYGILT
jgi:hypothetical protein